MYASNPNNRARIPQLGAAAGHVDHPPGCRILALFTTDLAPGVVGSCRMHSNTGGEPASSSLDRGNVFAEKLPGYALGALVGLTLSEVQPKFFMH